ncbi:Fungal specific transcription factor domain [Ceratobasidium sp. AG-Ba]|nr:Fungal specific transcription factor domain [Ceratobasidium sp. AG-Ba]
MRASMRSRPFVPRSRALPRVTIRPPLRFITRFYILGDSEIWLPGIALVAGPKAPGGNSSLLEISSRWLAGIASAGDLASALRRGGDRQRAIIQVAIHIDIFSSITLCRPPSLLDAYRAAFKNVDPTTSADSNGVRVAVEPRLDDLLDIPAKTLLALAETAAMASWKAEHVRQGSLSVMDLSRWAKRIDALLVPPSPESLAPQTFLHRRSLIPSDSRCCPKPGCLG